MLTPKLEDLIFSGQAMYKTAAMGIGMAQAIVIPQNSYAVITDLHIQPFKDTETAAYEDMETYYQQNYINQVWIRSRLGNNHFVIRPNTTNVHQKSAGAHFISFQSEHFNTYLVHDGVIRFTWNHLESPPQWAAIDNNQLQDISNEESAGLGTASIAPGFTTIKQIAFGNGQNYQPPTSVRDPQPVNLQGADQYRQYPYSNQLTGNTSNVFAFPIVNVGYVQIQGKPAFLTS